MNQWIANILGVVVLGILMDMIIPTGNTKAYTRFFIGLIMLLVMLQPVIKLIGQFPNYSDSLWLAKIAPELEAIDTTTYSVELDQEKHLMRMYKSRLERDVLDRARAYISDVDVTANVNLVKSQGPATFEIDSIQVFLGPPDPYKVQEVEISIDLDDSSEKKKQHLDTQDELKDFSHLKKHLSDTYEIEESRIHIVGGKKTND
jgi:stage III sporulation protein AF